MKHQPSLILLQLHSFDIHALEDIRINWIISLYNLERFLPLSHPLLTAVAPYFSKIRNEIIYVREIAIVVLVVVNFNYA